MRRAPARSFALGFVLATATVVAGAACRGDARRTRLAGSGADDATGLPSIDVTTGDGGTAPAPEVIPSDVPTSAVEPGVYATDDRLRTLAATWEARVRAAADRLELATGLSFRDRAAPRVVLAPLPAEVPAWTAEREVFAGRRRSAIRVNVRPLVVGREDADRVLARALAEAAVQPARSVDRPPPRWFARWVGHVAAGDTADAIERLARDLAATRATPRVDPSDPAFAEPTALAAALLLGERSTPADVRRAIALVADGDDAERLVRRAAGDATSPWAGAGREILEDAIGRVDLSTDHAIAAFRRALSELGPAGLEQALEDAAGTVVPTDRVRAEVEALRLQAALRSGDAATARGIVGRAPCATRVLALLDDPGAFVLDTARVELLEGGDPTQAWIRLACFDRDFPSHDARPDAFEEMERLVGRVGPTLETTVLARLVAERGGGALHTATIARRVRALLDDERPGAARRFVADLGTRADDEELAPLRAAIDAAEAEPTLAARDRNRARVAAWVDAPSAATEADVVDGGAVAADALVDRLPAAAGDERVAAVRVLLRAAGTARAVALLAPEWSGAIDRFAPDAAILASECGYADLRRSVEAMFPAVRTDARAAAEWERVCLGIEPVRLASDDGLLARLHSPEFTVRREAFDAITAGADPVVTPLLLRHFARDPAILLRRLAVRAAGRAGLGMIAQEALADPSWIVRQAACAAIVDGAWFDAAPDVAALLTRPDPDERVQDAAAAALVRIAAAEPGWVRAVVSIVRVATPRLADGVAALVRDLPGPSVARAAAAELWIETAGPDARLDSAVLFRLFTVYRRAAGRDPRYDPSLDAAEVRALVAALPELAAPTSSRGR